MAKREQDILNERLLLVSGISLRYWELSGVIQTDSKELLRKVLKYIQPKEKLVEDMNYFDNMKNLGMYLAGLIDAKGEQNPMMAKQAIRMAIKDDKDLYETITYNIDPNRTTEEIENLSVEWLKLIIHFDKREDFMKEVKKTLTSVAYGDRHFNLAEQATAIIQQLTPYTTAILSDNTKIGLKSPLVNGGFSTTDIESIESAWANRQEKASPLSVLKTGYRGLNRALGPQGGFFRGDTIVLAALQHNYKSGMVNDLVMDIAHNNEPYFFTDKKRAGIIHISFENHVSDDINRIYQRIYAIENKRLPSLDDIIQTDPKHVSTTINNYMGKNGFEYIYVRINPSECSYLDVLNFVREIEESGVEVHVLAIDYLITMSTRGIMAKGDGTEYQEMYRMMRNYCSAHAITFITPHQLSTEATYLNRDEIGFDFTSKVAGRSYYAKSKQIDREVDVEIIQHICKKKDPGTADHQYYLTLTVGKNRQVHGVKDTHKSCALPFTDLGLMPDYQIGEELQATFKEISDLKKGLSGFDNDSDLW